MKFAILVAALLATPILMPVPALGAQVIGTTRDMVIEVSQGHLVRFDRPASVVFVANSEIAEVAVKSPHLIFVVGKKPGVTTLYAVDQNETCWRAKLAVNYLAFFKLAFDPPLASHL